MLVPGQIGNVAAAYVLHTCLGTDFEQWVNKTFYEYFLLFGTYSILIILFFLFLSYQTLLLFAFHTVV